MKITKEEISNIKMMNNNVLIKPDGEFNDSIIFKDGSKIYLDPSFEKERHSCVIGDVVKTPKRLNFKRMQGVNSMEWDCDIQVKDGDRVWMQYSVTRTCFQDNSKLFINEDGEFFMIIPYGSLIACKRDDKVIGLNGYNLIKGMKLHELPDELLNREVRNFKGLIPENFMDQYSEQFGEVLVVAVPNKRYRDPEKHDIAQIEVGDIIGFEKYADVPVEYAMHSKLFPEIENTVFYLQTWLVDLILRK